MAAERGIPRASRPSVMTPADNAIGHHLPPFGRPAAVTAGDMGWLDAYCSALGSFVSNVCRMPPQRGRVSPLPAFGGFNSYRCGKAKTTMKKRKPLFTTAISEMPDISFTNRFVMWVRIEPYDDNSSVHRDLRYLNEGELTPIFRVSRVVFADGKEQRFK